MHYIPLIDAGVSGSEKNGTYLPYDEGLKEDIFIKDEKADQPFVGKVWNLVSTVWPDFTNPKARNYYFHMMNDMYNNFKYDGAWIVCFYLLIVNKNNVFLIFLYIIFYHC